IKKKFMEINDLQLADYLLQLRRIFNNFSDIDKHYKRKEYLLFPFLEKHQITGPPKVMRGKHDETREMLKRAHEVLSLPGSSVDTFRATGLAVLDAAVEMIAGMIKKEEDILL